MLLSHLGVSSDDLIKEFMEVTTSGDEVSLAIEFHHGCDPGLDEQSHESLRSVAALQFVCLGPSLLQSLLLENEDNVVTGETSNRGVPSSSP